MLNVSLCIATYRRPEKLKLLLQDLVVQHRAPDEVIVVDNDADGSARPVVTHCIEQGAPFPIHYEIQPVKNISLTRNKTVDLASCEWLAFIDDDERAPPDWLAGLLSAASRFAADGVLGPVEPVVPATAPAWIRRGRFYDFPRMPSGTRIPPNRLRFGNVLLRGSSVRAMRPPFDPAYGLTGGEDGDLLSRLALKGLRLVWCDEAVVHEPVEPGRLSLGWLLRRALSGGQDFARHTLSGRYGAIAAPGRLLFLVRAGLQAVVAAALALATWPMGRHVAAKWLIALSANLGKLSAFSRWRYREYA
jgi:succinoglycan biosynthesis protein ExoM